MQLRQPLQFVLVYNINKHVLICLFCNISVRLHCLGHFVHVNIYGNWTYHTWISFTISYIFVISVYFHNFQKLWCTSDAERCNSFCCVGNVPWMLSLRADSGRVLCRVQVDGDNINIGCNPVIVCAWDTTLYSLSIVSKLAVCTCTLLLLQVNPYNSVSQQACK